MAFQLEIAGARLLDTKTSKEIQPAKWDSWGADSVDLAVLYYWLGVTFEPWFETAIVHFWAPKAVTIAARSHISGLTF